MTREEKEIFSLTAKKSRLLTAVSLCLMISLSLTKMVVANRASTWGKRLEDIKMQTEDLRRENLQLKTELTQRSGGLNELYQLATNRGFSSEVKMEYFPAPASVALTLP